MVNTAAVRFNVSPYVAKKIIEDSVVCFEVWNKYQRLRKAKLNIMVDMQRRLTSSFVTTIHCAWVSN